MNDCDLKLGINQLKLGRNSRRGFSIVEALVATGVLGITCVALLGGLTASVGHVQFGREQNRATQIMMEKLDVVRMYKWSQTKGGSFVTTNFTEYFFPPGVLDNGTNSSSLGTVYNGTVTVADAGIGLTYNGRMRKVTVSVEWQSGGRPVQRQMTTFISKHGLQLYIP